MDILMGGESTEEAVDSVHAILRLGEALVGGPPRTSADRKAMNEFGRMLSQLGCVALGGGVTREDFWKATLKRGGLPEKLVDILDSGDLPVSTVTSLPAITPASWLSLIECMSKGQVLTAGKSDKIFAVVLDAVAIRVRNSRAIRILDPYLLSMRSRGRKAILEFLGNLAPLVGRDLKRPQRRIDLHACYVSKKERYPGGLPIGRDDAVAQWREILEKLPSIDDSTQLRLWIRKRTPRDHDRYIHMSRRIDLPRTPDGDLFLLSSGPGRWNRSDVQLGIARVSSDVWTDLIRDFELVNP